MDPANIDDTSDEAVKYQETHQLGNLTKKVELLMPPYLSVRIKWVSQMLPKKHLRMVKWGNGGSCSDN